MDSNQNIFRNINKFIYLPLVKEVTFAEANARCHALDKQLPEIYDDYSMAALAMVMKENKLTVVHAGIAFDPATAMQRFISTGMPLYRGFSRMIVQTLMQTDERFFFL